jgi:hypothetical protein
MTVWACHRCHEYLDSGDFLSKKEKAKLFDNSWYRQVGEWWAIADTISTKPWKVEAALRVLQHIGAKR